MKTLTKTKLNHSKTYNQSYLQVKYSKLFEPNLKRDLFTIVNVLCLFLAEEKVQIDCIDSKWNEGKPLLPKEDDSQKMPKMM